MHAGPRDAVRTTCGEPRAGVRSRRVRAARSWNLSGLNWTGGQSGRRAQQGSGKDARCRHAANCKCDGHARVGASPTRAGWDHERASTLDGPGPWARVPRPYLLHAEREADSGIPRGAEDDGCGGACCSLCTREAPGRAPRGSLSTEAGTRAAAWVGVCGGMEGAGRMRA